MPGYWIAYRSTSKPAVELLDTHTAGLCGWVVATIGATHR